MVSSFDTNSCANFYDFRLFRDSVPKTLLRSSIRLKVKQIRMEMKSEVSLPPLSLSIYIYLLSLAPFFPIALLCVANLVSVSHRYPDGGNLIARQGQERALSMVLHEGSWMLSSN